MRKTDFIYTAILLPLDYLMLIFAGLFAYYLRTTAFIQKFDIVSDVFYTIPPLVYLGFLAAMAALWIVFFITAGLYSNETNRSFINQISKVFLGGTAGIAAVIIFLFFKREFLLSSRFIVLVGWGCAISFVVSSRVIVRIIRRFLLKKNIGAKSVVIIGSDANTKRFAHILQLETKWGYVVVGQAATMAQLQTKAADTKAAEVILTDINYSREKVNELLEFCQTHHIDFRYAADIFSASLNNIRMDAVAGFPLIYIKRTPLEGWGRVKKRLMDIIISFLAFILFSLLAILLAILIKSVSKGPVFVKLTRIGEHSAPFKIYKFRSMVANAHLLKTELLSNNERRGPLFKMKRDPRITPLGRFLRRFSLDELPNFYNVLIGNMSLVGPRPHEPEEVAQYHGYQRKLLNIKPGITGIAQISGRSSLNFDEEARLDLYYVENWSIKTDLAILFKTPFAVLFRRDEAT